VHYVNSKFEIFGKADTPETIDALLEALHSWLSNDGQCSPTNRCFVHELFFMNRETQLTCKCGKSGPVLQMDKNMFSET
jgi:hypothetical protein